MAAGQQSSHPGEPTTRNGRITILLVQEFAAEFGCGAGEASDAPSAPSLARYEAIIHRCHCRAEKKLPRFCAWRRFAIIREPSRSVSQPISCPAPFPTLRSATLSATSARLRFRAHPSRSGGQGDNDLVLLDTRISRHHARIIKAERRLPARRRRQPPRHTFERRTHSTALQVEIWRPDRPWGVRCLRPDVRSG